MTAMSFCQIDAVVETQGPVSLIEWARIRRQRAVDAIQHKTRSQRPNLLNNLVCHTHIDLSQGMEKMDMARRNRIKAIAQMNT